MLCHIFLSAADLKWAFCPKHHLIKLSCSSSSSPTLQWSFIDIQRGPRHCHNLLTKIKSLPPYHVAQSCQLHQNAQTPSSKVHPRCPTALPALAPLGSSKQIKKPQNWCFKGSGTSLFAGNEPALWSSTVLCPDRPKKPSSVSGKRKQSEKHLKSTCFD